MAETRRTTRVPKATKTKPVDEYGHLQPQAPELEEAVLGALMIEKDAYSLVSEILRPESFYEHRNQLIYAAITDLAIQQKPIDILTVTEQLRSRGDLDEVGGPFYITQLSGKVASSAHIEYHARIIAQKVSGTRADLFYQQHPDKGVRRDSGCRRSDAGSRRKTLRNLAAEHEERLYAD